MRGFTLIEMLLAVVVIAVVGITISTAIGGVAGQTYALERRTMALRISARVAEASRSEVAGAAARAGIAFLLFWVAFIVVTLVLSLAGTFLLLKVLDGVMGLRVAERAEIEGLDYSEHGMHGYDLGAGPGWQEQTPGLATVARGTAPSTATLASENG